MSVTTIKSPPVYQITAVQLAVTAVLAIVAFLLLGEVSAYSVLLGGLISTVPNAYFAYKVFRYRGASAMTRVVRAAFVGEAVKLGMIGAGFALVFIMVETLDAMALFAGFVLIHLMGIISVLKLQAGELK